MNEPSHKVDELRHEIAEAEKARADASSRAYQSERTAKAELASLRDEYQTLVFDLLMGTSLDVDRKFELRTLIRGLEHDLTDIELLAKGFQAEKCRDEGRQRQLRVMERAVQTYGDLKDQIVAEGALAGLVEDLKLWARKLDCMEDAEAFLDELDLVAGTPDAAA